MLDVVMPLEAGLQFRFAKIEINANKGGKHRGWFSYYSRRVGREIAPSIKYGLDILFVPHLPDLPYEKREEIARSEKLIREVEVVKKRILDIAKQNRTPRTGPPLGMTHETYKTGYIVPRRV
jgi:hypothetical protein